jgi:DNA repair protein RAD5
VECLDFSPLERKIYESLYTDAKRDFEQLNAKGLVSKNYTHILAMLMRYVSSLFYIKYLKHLYSLRRAVLHPSLVLPPQKDSGNPSDTRAVDIDTLIKQFSDGEVSDGSRNVFAETVLVNLGEDDGLECPICFDVMQTPMILPECLHQWQVDFADVTSVFDDKN